MSHFSTAAAKMVGAKNMHSSSGWAVTKSARPPARMPRAYPPVTKILSQPSNTAKATAIAATTNGTEIIIDNGRLFRACIARCDVIVSRG